MMQGKKSILLRAKRKIGRILRGTKQPVPQPAAPKNKIKFLLLTNRDSDNCGDQVIEACDIALMKAVEKNLGLLDSEFQIISRELGIVSQNYLASRNPALLEKTEKLVNDSEIVIGGGHRYSAIYTRTSMKEQPCY